MKKFLKHVSRGQKVLAIVFVALAIIVSVGNLVFVNAGSSNSDMAAIVAATQRPLSIADIYEVTPSSNTYNKAKVFIKIGGYTAIDYGPDLLPKPLPVLVNVNGYRDSKGVLQGGSTYRLTAYVGTVNLELPRQTSASSNNFYIARDTQVGVQVYSAAKTLKIFGVNDIKMIPRAKATSMTELVAAGVTAIKSLNLNTAKINFSFTPTSVYLGEVIDVKTYCDNAVKVPGTSLVNSTRYTITDKNATLSFSFNRPSTSRNCRTVFYPYLNPNVNNPSFDPLTSIFFDINFLVYGTDRVAAGK